jgi:glutaminyl-tRNA synthetase
VRLKNAYIIKCEEVIKDENGKIVELRCTYAENSKSGSDTSGISVKGVIHWVSIPHALPVEARMYDRLLTVESLNDIPEDKDFMSYLNPESLKIQTAYAEPALAEAQVGEKFQFMRKGYFCTDPDSSSDKMVFNLTVSLKDSWAKEAKKG